MTAHPYTSIPSRPQDVGLPSYARLREVLRYDPETGVFTWIAGIRQNRVAGTVATRGYIQIKVDGVAILAHRLAWFYMTRAWPVYPLDHKNGVTGDNRWQNLRRATHSENSFNQKKRKNSLKEFKGVFRYNANGKVPKYRAQIGVRGKVITKWGFLTPEDAHKAYLELAHKHYGQFVRPP